MPQDYRAFVTAACFDLDRDCARDRSRACRHCVVVIPLCFDFHRNLDRRVPRRCGFRIAVCFDLDCDRHDDHGRACRRTKTVCANFHVDRHRVRHRSRACRHCGVVIAVCLHVHRNRDRRVRRHCGLRSAVCFDFDRHRHGDHGRACRHTKTACANWLVRNVRKAVTALRGLGMERLR